MKWHGQRCHDHDAPVAPFAGAWIEMRIMSNLSDFVFVAPFAGAWIEITINWGATVNVAPFAGAWIEILKIIKQFPLRIKSLPSRERGLKLKACYNVSEVIHCRSLRGSVD